MIPRTSNNTSRASLLIRLGNARSALWAVMWDTLLYVVYLILFLLLLAGFYRLVLLPYVLYRFLSTQVPSLPFIPFFGHAPLLLYGFLTNRPLSFGLNQLRAHGRHTFLFSFMHFPTIQTCHPLYIQQLLRQQYHHYDKGPISKATMEPLVGANNVLVGEEPLHARHRRMVMPAFHGATLQSMVPLIIDRTAAHIADLRRRLAGAASSRVDIKAEFTALMFDVLTSCAFGTSLTSLPHSTATLHRTFHTLLDALYVRNLLFVPHIPVVRDLPILHLPALRRGRAEVESLVHSIIGQRRAGLSSSLCAGPDLLDLLLTATDDAGVPFTEDEVRDQALAFIFAGFETLAGLTSFLFLELAQRPALLGRLRAEVEEATGGGALLAEHLSAMPLVEAVIQEALRLYPVAPLMFRRATSDHALCPAGMPAIAVRAGAFVVADVYSMQRMGWEEPDEFRPERWMGKGGASGKGEGMAAGAFLPFSVGMRSCIGNAFAMQEARTVTALMVRAFDIDRDGIVGEVKHELKVSYAPREVWVNMASTKKCVEGKSSFS